MTVHPKTLSSYETKAHLYFSEEGDDPPLISHLPVSSLLPALIERDVLVIGCGGGRELLYIAERQAKSISAIDASPFLVEKARERCSSAAIQQGSIEALPYASDSFDFIYCAHLLHYFDSWDFALTEIKRVLRVGGQLVVTLHHPLDWGLERDNDGNRLLGFKSGSQEFGHYLEKRGVPANWYGGFEVVYYSRSIADSVEEFVCRGFRLLRLTEAGLEKDAELPVYFAMSFSKGDQ